jgi:hypothetical protein
MHKMTKENIIRQKINSFNKKYEKKVYSYLIFDFFNFFLKN